MNIFEIKNIEGKNFKKHFLVNENFKKIKSGKNKLVKLLALIFGIVITSCFSLIPVFAGDSLATVILRYPIKNIYSIFLVLTVVILYFISIIIIVLRGFEVQFSIIFSLLGLISIMFVLPFGINETRDIWSISLILVLSISLSWLSTIITAFSLVFNYVCEGFLGEFIAFMTTGSTITILTKFTMINAKSLKYWEYEITLIAGLAIIIAGAAIAQKAVKGDPKFAWIKEKTVFWAAIGGTSFYGADLTDACFDGADLPHTDFRKAILTRTSFEGATRLDLSRLQGTILEQPKVRKLLITKRGDGEDYTGANFEGANLRGANLTGAILKEVKALDADFSEATLTGACIENWSINSETRFTGVQCDYIYRELDENGKPTARYPVDRNFEPGEFESLFQEVGNVVELIFKEGIDWRALSFSFRKLQLDDQGLGLELKGVEKRGDLWVVKVTYKEGLARPMVEERVTTIYDDIKNLLAIKEQQINKLLGIASNQAEALKNQSHQPFGNSFFIFGSTITNLAGSGQIDYDEAASKIRSIVANSSDISQVAPIAQNLLQQLQTQSVASSLDQQVELIQQVILSEAKKDPFFKQFLVQQSQQITEAMPESAITTAIRNAIAKLS